MALLYNILYYASRINSEIRMLFLRMDFVERALCVLIGAKCELPKPNSDRLHEKQNKLDCSIGAPEELEAISQMKTAMEAYEIR